MWFAAEFGGLAPGEAPTDCRTGGRFVDACRIGRAHHLSTVVAAIEATFGCGIGRTVVLP